MKIKEKIVSVILVIMPILILGLAGFTCKAILDQSARDREESEKIAQCHKLLGNITEQYEFDRLESSDFDQAHKCFSDNRQYCSDFRRDSYEFSKKLATFTLLQLQFQSLKNASSLEKELFLIKLNRVLMVSDDYCYKGSCKRLGKSFICSE